MDNMEAMGQASPQTEMPAGDFCIEICVRGGQITVESGPIEADEQGEPTGTPVASLEEALAKVREMFAQGGQGGEEAFNAGFGTPEASPMQVRVREGE